MRESADAVRSAGLPPDPDEFVDHIAAIWYYDGRAAHSIIAVSAPALAAMHLEWNETKTRRQYLIEFASVWVVVVALAFLPVWWLVQGNTF